MVLDKIKTDGLMPTLDAVRNKLEQPLPLGYCNVGRVLEVGKGVDGFVNRPPGVPMRLVDCAPGGLCLPYTE